MKASQITKNKKYGYYTLKKPPSKQELEKYYRDKYYQESLATYYKKYSDGELNYISNKIKQKHTLLKKYLKSGQRKTMLDIGCGEGWTLKYYKNLKWKVMGIDYSKEGCLYHNPGLVDDIVIGDIKHRLNMLIKAGKKFELITLDNVLEHIIKPEAVIKQCKLLLVTGGLLLVEVPNDFSKFHTYLLNNKYIDKPYWVTTPDHISYFNSSSLSHFFEKLGWKELVKMGDYPIELNLLNQDTNYYKHKELGKNVHNGRVAFERYLEECDTRTVVKFYETILSLGLGRQIVGIFSSQ